MESVVEERRERCSCWMILWGKVIEHVLSVNVLYGSQPFIVHRSSYIAFVEMSARQGKIHRKSGVYPNVAKVGSLQRRDGKGDAVVYYREPLTTKYLKIPGFPEG
jgi:hypothetical protein